MNRLIHLLCASLLLVLAACGGGGGLEAPPRAEPALAVNTLIATPPVPANPADTSGDLLLTRLSVTLAADATVEQLEAAMAAVGATGFAYASPGSPSLTLAVPRQATGAALVVLAQRLRAMPGIASAAPGRQMATLILPGQEAGSPQSPDMLQHLLPSRFPAAWNAAFDERGQRSQAGRCQSIAATIIVADYFQSMPPDPGAQLDLFDYAQRFGAFPVGTEDHGWQAVATLASQFDELDATGAAALTECLQYVLVDISLQTYEQIVALLKQAIAAQPASARLIVNLSFGFGKKFCGPNVDQVCTAENTAATPVGLLQSEIERRLLAAIDWAEFSNSTLDERMLLVQAAGNEKVADDDENGGLGVRYAGMRQASLISPFALATQLASLDPLFSPQSVQAVALWTGEQLPSLLLDDASLLFLRQAVARRASRVPGMGNLLLVGSATLPDSHWHGDIAESAFSNEGAMLLAVGEKVVGLGGTFLDGTSFAAPQVAGLAAYLWSISDLETLPASDTAAHIKATATSRALLDAFAATLALDTLPAIGASRIRELLLDVNGDDRFDESDLQRFAEAYGLNDPNTPTIPSTRDYSRFDLNGDGATGGINAVAFDLDRGAVTPGRAPVIAAVDRAIEGYPVTFNEPVLSDLQVLCFYAYSPLFAGGAPTPAQEALRTATLGPDRCVGARMNTLFAAQVSGAAPLEVTVEVPAGSGQYAPAPDMFVAFTPSCGSVSPASGRTDVAGRVSTTVTPTGCSGSVSVTAVASANAGTTALARKVVTAALGVGSSIYSLSINVGGRTPGMIEAWILGSGDDRLVASGPVGAAASVMAQVSTALAGVSEITYALTVYVYEPVSLSLNLAIPVGAVAVGGQTTTACTSNISVSVGEVRKQGTSPGTAGVGGCLGRATLVTGDVGDSVVVNGTNSEFSVIAGKVARAVIVGAMFGPGSSSMNVNIRTPSYNALGIYAANNSTVNVQGSIERQPSQSTTSLSVLSSNNLTLGPITGGELNSFSIDRSSFASAPAISAGDIVRQTGDTGGNTGNVRIIGSSGLSLGAIRMGSIAGELQITDNRGFSNTDASEFAQARTVGGATRISGNQP